MVAVSPSSFVSFTQFSPTCGRIPLPALSLWPGRQPCRPRLVDGRRGGGPSSVAPRSRNPPTGRVERCDCAHEALPRLQSASSWLVMEQLVYGVCRLSCAFHAAGNSPPDVRRSDTGQYVYTVQVRWFEAARDDSAAVV